MLIVCTKFDFIFTFIANIIDNRFESTGIDGTFENIIDVDSIAENSLMFIEWIRNPMKKETFCITFGYMSTKWRMKIGILF